MSQWALLTMCLGALRVGDGYGRAVANCRTIKRRELNPHNWPQLLLTTTQLYLVTQREACLNILRIVDMSCVRVRTNVDSGANR